MTIQIRITPATLILSLCATVALVPALTRAYIDPNDLFNSPIMGNSTSSDPCAASSSSTSSSQGSASSIDYLSIIPFGEKVSSASSLNYLAIIPFGQPVSSSSIDYIGIIPFGTAISSSSSSASANPCSSSSVVSTSSSSRSSGGPVAGASSSAGAVQYVNNGAGGKTRIIVKEPTYVTNEAPMQPFPVTVPVETHAAAGTSQLPTNTQTVGQAGGNGALQASILNGQTTALHSGAPAMAQSGPGSALALLLVLIAGVIVFFRIPQKAE